MFSSSGKADLFRASHLIRKNREEIISIWEKRVKAAIHPLQKLSHPLLVDSIPKYVDELSKSLLNPKSFSFVPERATPCEAHGSIRAKFTSNSLLQLVQEYQILRTVIIDVLGNSDLSSHSWKLIHIYLDKGTAEAVSSFAIIRGDKREEFVYALTHDIRSPLSAAILSSQMLERFVKNTEEQRLASRVVKNLQKANTMIQDLIEGVRFGSIRDTPMHPTRIELGGLVQQVVTALSSSYGEDRFRISYEHPIWGFWDQNQLLRCFQSLINVTSKYVHDQDKIELILGEKYERVQIHVPLGGYPVRIKERLTLVDAVAEHNGGSTYIVRGSGERAFLVLDFLKDSRIMHQDVSVAA